MKGNNKGLRGEFRLEQRKGKQQKKEQKAENKKKTDRFVRKENRSSGWGKGRESKRRRNIEQKNEQRKGN